MHENNLDMILASFPCHCPVLQATSTRLLVIFCSHVPGPSLQSGNMLKFGLGVRLKFGLGMRLKFGPGMRLKFGLGMRLKFVYEKQIECGKQLVKLKF